MCARAEKARLSDSANLSWAYLIQGDSAVKKSVTIIKHLVSSPKVIVKCLRKSVCVNAYCLYYILSLHTGKCNNDFLIDCTFPTREFVYLENKYAIFFFVYSEKNITTIISNWPNFLFETSHVCGENIHTFSRWKIKFIIWLDVILSRRVIIYINTTFPQSACVLKCLIISDKINVFRF